MLSNVDTSSVVAFFGILSTGLLGWFGYRRSKKADSVAERAGAVEQIIGGLNTLVDNLQDDNKILRDNVKELRDALQAVTQERDEIRAELKALVRQHGKAA
jgi:LPXTG-motif cell wall-anchored protein